MARRRRPMPSPVAPAAPPAGDTSRPEVDLDAKVAEAVARATAPKSGPVAVCSFCGWRYRPSGATRQVAGRLACGACIRWTDRSNDDPLTESKILDSAVCRLVGMRQTMVGASERVPIVPWYAQPDAPEGGQPKRWGHVNRDRLIADFDRAYPPGRVSGKIVRREVEIPGQTMRANGFVQPATKLLPPEYVPAPPLPPQRSPRRPLTDHERRLEQLETKRRLGEDRERQRLAQARKAQDEIAKQEQVLARLEAR